MPAIDCNSFFSPCQAKKHPHASPNLFKNRLVEVAKAIVENQKLEKRVPSLPHKPPIKGHVNSYSALRKKNEPNQQKVVPHDPQKVYVFQNACFVDAIWYEAVKEVLGEEEGGEGEQEGSE